MELLIERDLRGYKVNFWLLEDSGGLNVNYQLDNQTGTLQRITWPTGEFHPDEARPLISLPRNIADAFIREIVKHADSEGIKPLSTHNLEGVISAQAEHLKDARELLRSALDPMFETIKVLAAASKTTKK